MAGNPTQASKTLTCCIDSPLHDRVTTAQQAAAHDTPISCHIEAWLQRK